MSDIKKEFNEIFRCEFCVLKFETLFDLKHHQIDQEHLTIDTNPDPLLDNDIKEEAVTIAYFCADCPELEFEEEEKYNEHLEEHQKVLSNVKVEISEIDENPSSSTKPKPVIDNSRKGKVGRKVKHEFNHLIKDDFEKYTNDQGQVAFRCKICNKKETLKLKNIKEHILSHKPHLRPYSCDKCDRKFVSSFFYKQHLNSHNENYEEPRNFVCSECGCTFKTKGHLRSHSFTHNPEAMKFQCDFAGCNLRFRNFSSMKKHRVIHEDPENYPFECETCLKRFHSKNSWKAHNNTHLPKIEGIHPFKCDFEGCDQFRSTKQSLDYHKEKEHSINPRIYFCPECPKEFRTKLDANNHYRYVHNELSKRFECDFCGLRQHNKKNLTAHIFNSHLPESKPFKCNIPGCGKSYARERRLMQHHAGAHTNEEEKRFECKTCGKRYGVMATLKLHEAVHLPMHLRRYKCNVCEKGYTRAQFLREHQAKHNH